MKTNLIFLYCLISLNTFSSQVMAGEFGLYVKTQTLVIEPCAAQPSTGNATTYVIHNGEKIKIYDSVCREISQKVGKISSLYTLSNYTKEEGYFFIIQGYTSVESSKRNNRRYILELNEMFNIEIVSIDANEIHYNCEGNTPLVTYFVQDELRVSNFINPNLCESAEYSPTPLRSFDMITKTDGSNWIVDFDFRLD